MRITFFEKLMLAKENFLINATLTFTAVLNTNLLQLNYTLLQYVAVYTIRDENCKS